MQGYDWLGLHWLADGQLQVGTPELGAPRQPNSSLRLMGRISGSDLPSRDALPLTLPKQRVGLDPVPLCPQRAHVCAGLTLRVLG